MSRMGFTGGMMLRVTTLSALSLAGVARAEPELPGPSPSAVPCVRSGAVPPPDVPWETTAALCKEARRGIPAAWLAPPTGVAGSRLEETYAQTLRRFVIERVYANQLGWLSDARWRLTGPVSGCPKDGTLKNYGVHPAVRMYYSPEVITWLCNGRVGELPPGAVIVKEMHPIDDESLRVEPGSQLLSIVPSTQPEDFTVMVRARGGARDQWFWAYFSAKQVGNPPIRDRSAVTSSAFPASPQQQDPRWLPTGNAQDTVVAPYYGFGLDCINCHASAEREQTFATLDDLIGKEHLYKYLGSAPGLASGLLGSAPQRAAALAAAVASNPFPSPLGAPDPAFLAAFPTPGPTVTFAETWRGRFPAETYDHVTAGAVPGAPGTFVTSDQCIACHDATITTARLPNMVLEREGRTPLNLSPYAEWRASPMGLAGRDPIFFAQLESETNRAYFEPGLRGKAKCIENLCFHCHGAMGKRALAEDTASSPPDPDCAQMLPKDQQAGGQLFTRRLAAAWRDENGANARYGALARDGVSCIVCHKMAPTGLGDESTHTGNFTLTAAPVIYGPYPSADVKPRPMENALGMTPKEGSWLREPGLCGSCHAVELPVFRNDGTFLAKRYEQATTLEWANSSFAQTPCQDCHMAQSSGGKKLTFKIANIEDDTFPDVAHRLPDSELTLKERTRYPRHTLFGLNLFLNAFFQQFPLLLGVRQIDYMNGKTEPALIAARETVLAEMRPATAAVSVQVEEVRSGLVAQVTVANLAGHNLPSGVGFRRAFLEVVVLDELEQPLWASGLTSRVGEIQDGLTGRVLPSESFAALPSGRQAFQPHHQTITRGDQVQIYEELVQDSDGVFTTSFLHQVSVPKDNRLRPEGWRIDGPYAEETKPIATGDDPDYGAAVLSGKDTTRYEIPLDAKQLARARGVRATLYYQAIPPSYLRDRFQSARLGPSREDIRRLYFLASTLDTDAPAADGELYLQNWKLAVASQRAELRAP